MIVIVTRPAEDAAALVRQLESRGHRAISSPLLRIVARPGVAPPVRPWQAILATSANAIRALTDPRPLQSLRLLTVGPQSLRAARLAGFAHAEAHGGDVDGLAAHVAARLDPAAGPLLYLSGAETAGDLAGQLAARGFDVTPLVLYDAVAATDLGDAATALRDGSAGAVLLYSPRTARIWAKLVEAAGLAAAARHLPHFCLSANVRLALPPGWPAQVAERPDEAALLTLLEQTARTR
jgi:uroporphyrinogen-III synthase